MTALNLSLEDMNQGKPSLLEKCILKKVLQIGEVGSTIFWFKIGYEKINSAVPLQYV